jgi:hypothetical protein
MSRMTDKMNNEQFDQFLEGALKRHAKPQPVDEAAVGRVLKRLAGPLPRQKMPFWRWPSVLLDWEFAPAWPRMAALAGCAVLGFAIGIAGLDRRFDDANAPFALASRGDIGSIVFEAEPLTGARP